jgi:P-type conjugative transfer protein TrbG
MKKAALISPLSVLGLWAFFFVPLSWALDAQAPEPTLPPSPVIDLASVAATLEQTNENLLDHTLAPEIAQAMNDAKVEYAQSVRQRTAFPGTAKPEEEAPSTVSLANAQPTLESLVTEVEELRSKVAVEKASLLALQSPRRAKVTGAKTVFNYLDTSVYEVTSAVDHVTDIQLKAGESLTTPPTSGDTVRWSIGVMKSGAAPTETTHLIVKPLDDNIQTNLIIATDQHVYQLRLKSGPYHMPVVAWNYPEDSERAFQAAVKREASIETTINPDQLRFSYEISSTWSYSWTPVRVFDDGKKTFIQMPKDMRVSEAPVLFLIEDGSEPLLTNYRVKGDYYIVDRLIEKAELRVGPTKKVTIELERPNWFERNFL